MAEKKAKDIAKNNATEMGSKAAYWAGNGTPLPVTPGDVETMAAPRPGFDPSLNPGGPNSIESTHTTDTAANEATEKAGAIKAAAVKGEEPKAAVEKATAPAKAPAAAPTPAPAAPKAEKAAAKK